MRGAVSDGRPYRDPKANKSAIRSYKLHEKARKKLVGEGEEPSPSIFFSSLLENRFIAEIRLLLLSNPVVFTGTSGRIVGDPYGNQKTADAASALSG